MEKKFLAFLLTISVTTGYPEVGYNYRQPIGGVGGGAFGGNLIGGVSSGGFHGGGGGVSIGSSSFGGSGVSGGSFSGAGFGSSGGSFGGAGFGSSGGISSGHGGFTSSTSSSSAGYVQRPALIQKHIYVHVPPPEPEEFQQQKQVSFGVPQKHYKIIFIKVPSAPSISQQQISLASQNQEKTIVYVLVKKPDDFADISAPTIPTTPPSKPEVYFIKYKAQRQTTSTGGEYQHHTGSSGGSIGIGSGGGLSGSAGISSIGAGSGGFAGGNLIGIGGGGGGGIPSTQYGPPGKSGPY